MTVKASDNGRPQLEDVCTLAVKVKDRNDNSPVFDRANYDVPVAQDTQIGTQIMRVSATDVDEGDNQKIVYDLSATRIPGLFVPFLNLRCYGEKLIGNLRFYHFYAKKSSKIRPKIIFNKKLFNFVQTLLFFGYGIW